MNYSSLARLCQYHHQLKPMTMVTLLFLAITLTVPSNANEQDDDCGYTKLHGQTPYENDGGCYFCGKFKGSSFPISDHNDLADNCQQMCDADPKCSAFMIARSASLHAHEYYWGSAANCCLEREEYPPELFINAHEGGDEPNMCEKETMCWTRYEANTSSNSCKKKKKKSKLCQKVWKARPITEEKKKKYIDFVKGGCNYNDKKFEEMLGEAYEQCKAEIAAEPPEPETLKQRSFSMAEDRERSAWIAHGVIGTIIFGILVPISTFTPFFHGLIPVGAYTTIHIATFVMTFVTVLVALKTMGGLTNVGESHSKESHHIVGLLLLLFVSIQTLGSIQRDDKSRLVTVCGLFAFAFGVYEVHSGLGIFALKYDTIDLKSVYLGYIGWLMLVVIGAKVWMRKTRVEYTRIQMKAFRELA